MLLEGAAVNSPSYKQIREIVFSIPSPGGFSSDAVRNAVQAISSNIVYGNDDINLTVSDANSAWVAPSFPILDSYVAALKTYYNAEAYPLTNATAINNWVANATNDKITTIIDDNTAQNAALILLNAIYFKGFWVQPFSNDTTQNYAFNLLDGTVQDTAMMYTEYDVGSAIKVAKLEGKLEENDKVVDCIAVRLAYLGDQYSAVVAMPFEGSLGPPKNGALTLEDGTNYASALAACRQSVVAALSKSMGSSLNTTANSDETNSTDAAPGALKWLSAGSPDAPVIKIYLPRFEIDFELDLSEALQSMGMNAIFLPGDFTGISTDGSLQVSQVKHKIFVKVDEEGTEAAAVTGIVSVTSAYPIEPPKELVVMFDRPFIFIIAHEDTGMALFAGEVYKPEKWGNA